MQTVMPTDAADLTDPWDFFAWLRAEHPVAWDAEHQMWLISRYDDAIEVLRNPAVFSSHAGHMSELGKPLILTEDPPAHGRLRRAVQHAFTARSVNAYAPKVQSLTSQLLDQMESEGPSADLVSSLSSPLPVQIIAEIIGIPTEDQERIWAWSYNFLASMERGSAWREAIRPTLDQLTSYFDAAIEDHRQRPRNDLISTLLNDGREDVRLTDDELFMMCEILMVAGNETTTNIISNAIVAMTESPDEYRRLVDDPDRAAEWVEETLRWNPSVRVPNDRKVVQDVSLHGQQLRVGDRVLVLTASANRDERYFPESDRFVLGRAPNKHLAFGYGNHLCLGAPLARLEATTAIREFVKRFPHFALDSGTQTVRDELMHTRGFRRLPLRLWQTSDDQSR